MACTHAETCPLFPKLRASLGAWRVNYCDTESEWLNCARYQRSLSGKPVPLALLPNGKMVAVIVEEEKRQDSGSTPETVAASSEPESAAAQSGAHIGSVTLVESLRAEPETSKDGPAGLWDRLRSWFGGLR